MVRKKKNFYYLQQAPAQMLWMIQRIFSIRTPPGCSWSSGAAWGTSAPPPWASCPAVYPLWSSHSQSHSRSPSHPPLRRSNREINAHFSKEKFDKWNTLTGTATFGNVAVPGDESFYGFIHLYQICSCTEPAEQSGSFCLRLLLDRRSRQPWIPLRGTAAPP